MEQDSGFWTRREKARGAQALAMSLASAYLLYGASEGSVLSATLLYVAVPVTLFCIAGFCHAIYTRKKMRGLQGEAAEKAAKRAESDVQVILAAVILASLILIFIISRL